MEMTDETRESEHIVDGVLRIHHSEPDGRCEIITVRDCIDCGCLVPGGPTRCGRCAADVRDTRPAPYPEPTEPGWYWWRDTRGWDLGYRYSPEVLHVTAGNVALFVEMTGGGKWLVETASERGAWGPRVPEWRP